MEYHCPECKKELQKVNYPQWVKWLIGPIFGQFLKPLVCSEHGEIKIEKLSPEEIKSARMRRLIGIAGGTALNIALLALIFYLSFNS